MIILATYLDGELELSSHRNPQVAHEAAYDYFYQNSTLADYIINAELKDLDDWEQLAKYLQTGVDATYLVKDVH